MYKMRNLFQSKGTQQAQGLANRLFECVAAIIVAAAIALSASPSFAQGVGAQFNFPTSIPILSQLGGITPANFLPEIQNMVSLSNARDLASLGKQAAGVALRIEDLQIKFLKSQICDSNRIPVQYAKEVQIGCDLLGAQAELNKIKQSALALVGG